MKCDQKLEEPKHNETKSRVKIINKPIALYSTINFRYNPGLPSDYFRRKETKPVEESQLNCLTRKKITFLGEFS